MPSRALASASIRCAVLRRGSFLASRRNSGALATSILIASPGAAIAASRTGDTTQSRATPVRKPYRGGHKARRYQTKSDREIRLDLEEASIACKKEGGVDSPL